MTTLKCADHFLTTYYSSSPPLLDTRHGGVQIKSLLVGLSTLLGVLASTKLQAHLQSSLEDHIAGFEREEQKIAVARWKGPGQF